MTSGELRPFTVSIPESDLADLRERLARTRWPDAVPVDDWSQGTPLPYVQDVCRTWGEHLRLAAPRGEVDASDQYLTEIDGVDVHVLHARSPESDARPLVVTHGWPGSIVEHVDVIEALRDPVAHGRSGGGHPRHPICSPGALLALGEPTEQEMAQLGKLGAYDGESGYSRIQSTRPQSLGDGLTDSPAGQEAWTLEELRAWTDCVGASRCRPGAGTSPPWSSRSCSCRRCAGLRALR